MNRFHRIRPGASKLVAVTLAFVASGSAADDAIHEDWITRDVQVVERVAAAVPLRRTAVDELLKMLQPDSREKDQDIGFGLRRVRAALYGGYTTAWITIVGCDGRVESISVHSSHVGPAVWGRLREPLAQGWEARGGHLGDGVFDGEFHEPGIAEKCSRRRVAQLGTAVSIEPDAEVADAYRILSSPLSQLVFGTVCYESGHPPLGRTELETILGHESPDMALGNIVRGPNPEGRVYAAEGLLRLVQQGTTLSGETKRAIRWVYRSQTAIQVCDGCFGSVALPKTALSEHLPSVTLEALNRSD